jgi:hypothetical protein
MFKLFRPVGLALVLGLCLAFVSVAAADLGPSSARGESQILASASQEEQTDEVVLPSRVSSAITRTGDALARAEARIDDGQSTPAVWALNAVGVNVLRASGAAKRQMNAAPVDPESETTPGPDAVVAVLGLEQEAITRLAGLFDLQTRASVVSGLNAALMIASKQRIKLLNAVIALPAEGAGADYADAMADSLDGYADEVANLTEALAVDRLSPDGRTALTLALNRAKAAQAKINAAFGGGE